MVGGQNIWTLRPIKITDKCKCSVTINCRHNEWEVDCPYCSGFAYATYIHGPYFCKDCHEEFMGAVEYWTKDVRK